MILFRPTGIEELALVFESGMSEWPPRLPDQPIFYPVLNQWYATEIAREWNTKSNSFVGYVTRFEVEDSYVSKFEKQIVGGRECEELWVPSEELSEFNSHIIGRITVVDSFFGSHFIGLSSGICNLKGKTAVEQFQTLRELKNYNGMDFICETSANAKCVFLHYPYWKCCTSEELDVSEEEKGVVLGALQSVWEEAHPENVLCSSSSRAAV